MVIEKRSHFPEKNRIPAENLKGEENMKRTTRFITLVLTLILALSCSMQIFAEEIQRLPSDPLFCNHKTRIQTIQSGNYAEPDPKQPCRIVISCYDQEWCVQCNKAFKIDGTGTYGDEYYDHEWVDNDAGETHCIYCWRPKNP